MMCLCWRKKSEKNDLLGLDGLVTQMNPDENVNHLPATTINHVPDDVITQVDSAIDANKRSMTLNSSRRSLPDIPLDGLQCVGDVVNYERNGDNSSDLYATVEPYTSAKRHTLPNGIDSRPSISQHSSISQADDSLSPYARVKDHPYAKLKKAEHPYAHVQPTNGRIQDDISLEGSSRSIARSDRISTSQTLSEPSVPSRSPRSSEQSGVDIPAASAVAGGVAASQELPYMTPPIAQPNFSGDSQDSSKGYTSISVREPLANIRAQTKGLNKATTDLDPHYSTVSDDSDDVYTTIQDPNNVIYTSESETYAQIQPLILNASVETSSAGDATQRERQSVSNDHIENGLRPSLVEGRKNGIGAHSRQESSSSVSIVGSPKPEKRQANSPLPPPPPSSSNNLEIIGDKVTSFKTVDDMYAKVHKSKKKNEKDENVVHKEVVGLPQTSALELNDEQVENLNEHNYETLRKCSDPRYEKLKPKENEPNFEPGYDTINGPASILSSDPGYEALKHGSEVSSEEDPNYEELRHRTSSFSDSAGYSTIGNKLSVHSNVELDGYSVVQKQKSSISDDVKSKSSNYESDLHDTSIDEPNYESMPSEILSDHNYATLNSGDCESDPNYESVKYLDQSLEEPPYERLQDEDSSKTDSQQSSSDKIQNEFCVSETNTNHFTNHSSNGDVGNNLVKENLVSNPNSAVQLENDFDGIVQV
ncbi:hypothetical protein RN001_004919 [Aquatica leii]|uniref:Uncharacterized protein n=1 Tax=Aquatica leii TaxID=1421715 RepID=A0AAN7Q682_9COLE|nr:hypothetical protein RN001_004919 [Aquatica leii]